MIESTRHRQSLWLFLLIALGLPVVQWLLARASAQGLVDLDPSTGLWGFLRGYGPSLAAMVASAWLGRSGMRRLWRRVSRWRIPRPLLALAILGPVGVNLLALGVTALAGGADLTPSPIPVGRFIILFFLFALVDGPLGEEIGWRGYLLPSLLERLSAVSASLLVGIVWFLWHLPLYAVDGRALTPDFLARYLLMTLGMAVVYTWFFQRSRGSALLAVALHTASNYFYFLFVSLFPGLRESTLHNRIYVAIFVLLGVLAAISLRGGPHSTTR